jgi:four helix bundle protein
MIESTYKNSTKTELFGFQNWPVYQKALVLTQKFFLFSRILTKLGYPDLSRQLLRASSSVLLNIAEGVSRQTPKDRKNFWRISKGSLFECVAICDLSKKLLDDPRTEQIHQLIIDMSEVGRMLSALIRAAEK